MKVNLAKRLIIQEEAGEKDNHLRTLLNGDFGSYLFLNLLRFEPHILVKIRNRRNAIPNKSIANNDCE